MLEPVHESYAHERIHTPDSYTKYEESNPSLGLGTWGATPRNPTDLSATSGRADDSLFKVSITNALTRLRAAGTAWQTE
jgi:hypothetical protein